MPKTHRVLLLPMIESEQPQPLLHPKLQVVVIWKHPPLTTSWPAGHTHVQSACWTNLAGQEEGQVQVPVWQERGLVQTLHAVPPVPQRAFVFPGRQVVPSQHPAGQLAAVQAHNPATHTCPVAQTTGLPPTHVPSWQVSARVQRSPSSQGVLLATSSHSPVAGLQV